MKSCNKAGNIGDLLKHTWLVESTSFLRERVAACNEFRYADTFCGCKLYIVDEPIVRRYRYRFAPLMLSRLQERFLVEGRYAGSVMLVKEMLGDAARISIFDLDLAALDSFAGEGLDILECSSGYDILASETAYDLILLDPYNDVCNMEEFMLQGIARKSADSSVLLSLPCNTAEARDSMAAAATREGIRYLYGTIDTTRQIDDDECFNYAVFLFPARTMSDADLAELSGRLKGVTEEITYALNSGAIMTDIPVETVCDGVELLGKVASVMFNSIVVEMISPFKGRKGVKYLPLMMATKPGSGFYMMDEELQYETILRDAEAKLAVLYLEGSPPAGSEITA